MIKNEKPKVVGWFFAKPSPNFDFCACLSKKVVKPASSEMQGRVLHFQGHFDWFEAISANSRPQNVKNVLKMSFFGKTPGVNGLISYSKGCFLEITNLFSDY